MPLAQVTELRLGGVQPHDGGLGFSQASATVRLVCAGWKAVHDTVVTRLAATGEYRGGLGHAGAELPWCWSWRTAGPSDRPCCINCTHIQRGSHPLPHSHSSTHTQMVVNLLQPIQPDTSCTDDDAADDEWCVLRGHSSPTHFVVRTPRDVFGETASVTPSRRTTMGRQSWVKLRVM
jgi:hypothetical protein